MAIQSEKSVKQNVRADGRLSMLYAAERQDRISRILQFAYFFLLIYLLFNYGGVDPITVSIMGIYVGVMATVAGFIHIEAPALKRIWWISGCCLFVLVLWSLIQSLRFSPNPLEHQSWQIARDVLGVSIDGAISIGPEQTRADIAGFAPALAFLIAVTVYQREADAMIWLRRLAYFGGFFAVFGLVQLFFIPSLSGRGNQEVSLVFTSLFVNRNTAATFLGLSIVLSLGFVLYYLRSVDLTKIETYIRSGLSKMPKAYRNFLLFFIIFCCQVLALFLTQSRGGILATVVGISVLFLLLAHKPLTATRSRTSSAVSNKWFRVFVFLIIVATVFFVWGGRTAYRIEVQGGVDDTRLCAFNVIFKAIQDHWIIGSGFGRFREIFPLYRDHACMGTSGVWEMAHNSYLEGWLGLGIIFVLLVPVVIIVLIRELLRGVRARRRYAFAPAVSLACFVLVLVHSMFDFSLQIPGVSVFAAAIIAAGLCIGAARNGSSESPSDETP